MGEKRSIYLDEGGIFSLEFIRHFFRSSLFRQSNDSEIIGAALQLYLWFIREINTDTPSCPNPLCAKIITIGEDRCKNCGTLLKWVPTFAPSPPSETNVLSEQLTLAQRRLELAARRGAYSPAGTLTVKVDKESYAAGETITISGTVPAVLEGVPVAIQVFNPRNTMYTIDRLTPNADGTYSTTIKVGGKLGIDGIYTVKATYSGQSVQTTFEFKGGGGGGMPGTIRVEFEGNVFNVKASLSNGSITKIEVDPEFTSLIITVKTSATQDGTLDITLPRELVDARTGQGRMGDDDKFIVLVNGNETNFNEISRTSATRTLVIPAPAGVQEVEIIGTYVVGGKSMKR